MALLIFLGQCVLIYCILTNRKLLSKIYKNTPFKVLKKQLANYNFFPKVAKKTLK